jgi:alkylation response protein AidB-like acyl-CoA dehydrogenase
VHANWFASLCEIYDGDSPVRNEQGVPATAMFVTPASAVIIHETWDSLGLRGTSSHDYSITDAFVPEGWQFDLLGRSVRQGEAYFANPHIFGTLTTVPLGIARGAIDTVTALLRKKQAGPANLAVRDDAAVQIDLGRAVSLVDMAARYADGTLDEVWSQFQSGSRPTDRQLAGADLTKANEVSAAVEAMNIAFRLAGSSGVHRSSAIERCFRDVHTAASHVTLRPQARYQRGGRRLLSVSAGPPPAI